MNNYLQISKVKNCFPLFVCLVSFLALSLSVNGQSRQGTKSIYGRIVDQSNGEALPFATINLKGTSIGTISNADGEFNFQAPNVSDGIIICTFIGYENFEIALDDIRKGELFIEMEPSFIELKELVVTPVTAAELLRMAVRKIPENYATTAFETKAYYREKFIENDRPLSYNEGYFKSYYPDYQSDSSQHQLLLYRTADKLYDIGFMEKKRLKKEAKERRKAEKKGETYEEDFDESMIESSLGGPEGVIENDPVLSLESYLDTTEFKKFKYEYAGATNYLGREMIIISFETKGKVDHIKMSGNIFLDHNSDAIAAVEYTGKFVVPAWARPLLFSFGLAIHQPVFERKVRYQYHDGKWYPKYFYAMADLGLTKRYMFSSNERSDFDFEQVFTMNEIVTEGAAPIPKEDQFDSGEEMAKQMPEEVTYQWSQINTLPPEKLESRETQ